MNKEVFQKEEQMLCLAKESLERTTALGDQVDPVFPDLVKGYGRLLRQSRRLVTMGDRMQQSLSELNRDLAVSEEKYRGIFENVTEGIFRCDVAGNMVEVNPAMAVMFGFDTPEEFLDRVSSIRELFCTKADYERYSQLLSDDGVWRMEVKACGPDGIRLWAEVSASIMHENEDGVCSGVVGVLADVTERKHMLEEMCRLARTDSLTGLWNRGYFMELAEREVARSLRAKSPLSLLIVDADYFKSINDTYGHDVGDKALTTMSQVLLNSVREVDVVGRFGGEEFVVLLPDAATGDACCVADRILGNLRSALIEGGEEKFTMTASIGLASLDTDQASLDVMLKLADIALYAAKKNGRDRTEVYRPSRCPCPKGNLGRAVMGTQS